MVKMLVSRIWLKYIFSETIALIDIKIVVIVDSRGTEIIVFGLILDIFSDVFEYQLTELLNQGLYIPEDLVFFIVIELLNYRLLCFIIATQQIGDRA